MYIIIITKSTLVILLPSLMSLIIRSSDFLFGAHLLVLLQCLNAFTHLLSCCINFVPLLYFYLRD